MGNTGNNLSTSILDYALTLEKGLYSVSLSGSNYTGADLPNISYAYSSALIDVRKKGESVSVMLFGISTKRPLAVNSRDSNVWQGWQQYVTKDDFNYTDVRIATSANNSIVITGAPKGSEYIPVIVAHKETNNCQDTVAYDGGIWKICSTVSQETTIRFHHMPIS